MATTRWKDNEFNNIDEVLEIMQNKVPDDDMQLVIRKVDWLQKKRFESNLSVKFDNSDRMIEYNVIDYTYRKITKEKEDIINGMIVVYQDGINLNYIIDKNSDAGIVLRKLLKQNGRNKIEKNMISYSSDLFFWIISKVFYDKKELFKNDNELIKIVDVRGIKGKSLSNLTTASFEGTSVLECNSTLLLLFESDIINQIEIEMEIMDHPKICLKVKEKYLDVDEQEYIGEYTEKVANEKRPLLYLLIYCYIFPRLYSIYHNEVSDNLWTDKELRDFKEQIRIKCKNNLG